MHAGNAAVSNTGGVPRNRSTLYKYTVKPAYKHRGPPTGLVMLNIDYAYGENIILFE